MSGAALSCDLLVRRSTFNTGAPSAASLHPHRDKRNPAMKRAKVDNFVLCCSVQEKHAVNKFTPAVSCRAQMGKEKNFNAGDLDVKTAAVMYSVADVADTDIDLKPAAVMGSVADVADEEGVKVSDNSSDGVTEFCYITPEMVRRFNLGMARKITHSASTIQASCQKRA
eukprot:9417335-Ditylum_brightwellii.AAC.1